MKFHGTRRPPPRGVHFLEATLRPDNFTELVLDYLFGDLHGAGGDAGWRSRTARFSPGEPLRPWGLGVFALNPRKLMTENHSSKVILEHIVLNAKTQRRRDATQAREAASLSRIRMV